MTDSTKKFDPDIVYDKDGKPQMMGSRPLRHSMYEDFSDTFVAAATAMLADERTAEAIKKAAKR